MVKQIAKIALFSAIMLLVEKFVSYDRLTDFITGLFDFQSADKFTHFILGEPDIEVWESLNDYFSILINTLISVLLFGVVMTVYDAIIKRNSPADHMKEWVVSTSRRLLKVFWFIFLFWGAFRIMPYELIVNNSRSTAIYIAIVIINVIITIAAYISTMKLINKIRSK